MESSTIDEGVEVIHPSEGRGYITEFKPAFGAEPDEASVYFYENKRKTVPVYTLKSVTTVASASITDSPTGFEAVVDDGHCTVRLRPDGTGGGYTIELTTNAGVRAKTEFSIPEGKEPR